MARRYFPSCLISRLYIHFYFEYPHSYELIYQLEAIEYLFVYFQLDMFRAYTPIFRSNGC